MGKKILGILIILVCVVVVYFMACEWNERKAIDDGLELVRQHGGAIYAGAGSLCMLDLGSRTWRVVLPDASVFNQPQYYSIRGRKVLCETKLQNDEVGAAVVDLDTGAILARIPAARPRFELSHNAERVACFDLQPNQVTAIDLADQRTADFSVPEPNSLSWSDDDSSIYVAGEDRQIWRIDMASGSMERVASGWWVKALPEGRVGYWRRDGDDLVCYVFNVAKSEEHEVFRTNRSLLGADWSPTGRFVIASVFTLAPSSLMPTTVPFIWDTQTGREYRLPATTGTSPGGFKSDSFTWGEFAPRANMAAPPPATQ